MTISPLQHDYLTKHEFGEFKTEMYLFKDEFKDFKTEMYLFKDEMYEFKTEMYLFKDEMYEFKTEMYEFRTETNQRFDAIDKRFVEQRKELNEDYERHTGMLKEHFSHELGKAVEIIRGFTDKKVDKEEFEERMWKVEKHPPKKTRIIRKVK